MIAGGSVFRALFVSGLISSAWLHAQTTPAPKADCDTLLEKGSPTHLSQSIGVRTDTAHYGVATVKFDESNINSRYAIFLGNSETPAYLGNDPAVLAERLHRALPLSNGGSYYVSFADIEPHRAEGIVHTMKLQMDSIDPSLSLEPIRGDKHEWAGLMLKNVTDVVGEEKITPISERPGWFEGVQQVVLGGVQKVLLRVEAKAISPIRAFFRTVRTRVGLLNRTPDSGDHSFAEIVSSTKVEMKRKLKLSDAEFRTRVQEQTGRIFFVELRIAAKSYVG